MTTSPERPEDVELRPVLHDDVVRRVGIAWRELRRIAAMGVMRERVYGSGSAALELAQADALDLLIQFGRCRVSQLATALRIDPSSASRAVDRLVEQGFAVRAPEPDDARVTNISPTSEGIAANNEVGMRGRALMEGVLASFAPSDQLMLAVLMEQLVGALDEAAGEDSP